MGYLSLHNLKVYQLSCEYADECWLIYNEMDWKLKKIVGDQMIRSVDSVAANVAEGYGRFHYLDKIKFYYNARASLLESKHWIDTLFKRKFIERSNYLKLVELYKEIHLTLNGLINSTYKNKNP